MRAAYMELGELGMQIDWKERNTWKTLYEMDIAHVFIMYLLIFNHLTRAPGYARSNINKLYHTEVKRMC